MPARANLDALILREDFEVFDEPTPFKKKDSLDIVELEETSIFFQLLRKPDFQRETSDWNAEKITEFVQSFLNGDLIPGIILWYSGTHIFVIDGAHRLSALIAWVRDDYGNGLVSNAFFERRIPQEQVNAAEETNRLIQRTIGDYKAHRYAVLHPESSDPSVLERARRMAALAIQVQWVVGNADKAESSFFKINQQAVAIDPTELKLLEARKKPNALSARAIIHAGTGHKYWSKFEDNKKKQIQDLAKEIYEILFTPSLKTPIKTLDLPIAGKGFSSQALQLVFELVNLVNDVKNDNLDSDDTGDETIRFLKNTRRLVYRISGTHPSSLGLHPAIYFYGVNGRYQPTAFLAIVSLIKDFEKNDYFHTFTEYRALFENFIVKYKYFANQVATVRGSGTRGMKPLQGIYQTALNEIAQGLEEQEIVKTLLSDFNFLKLEEQKENKDGRRDFDADTKSTVFLRDALKSALKCRICQGYIHVNSMTVDHLIRKQDGGLGVLENAQLTHPYCNTTFKN